MAGAIAAGEILLERFFTNFRSLYTSKFDAQMALSKAQYRLYPVVGTGETFVSCYVWFEKMDEFLAHQDKFLMACKMSSLDGLDVIEVSPQNGDKPYKLLRVS